MVQRQQMPLGRIATIPSPPAVDSISVYRIFWLCWYIVGIATTYNKYLCGFYDLCVNLFITILYPLHLTMGLFVESTVGDIFKNLSINVTCIACTLKHYLLRYKLPKIRKVQRLLGELDRRAVALDEREFYQRVPLVGAKTIMNLFLATYVGANITAALATLLSSERRLMYPAWFPFDWRATTFTYYFALCYQIVGVSIQIVQNLANDTYPPMSLCIIGGHVRLLSMRVAKIGTDAKSTAVECNAELINCIEDHKKLVCIFELIQDTLSYTQLVQFISSGLNICIVLVYLIFYVDNSFFSYIYYTVYFVAMGIELFPCCYYGSILQQEFYDLSYAIFQSNWMVQSPRFHQNQRIFTELSLKRVTPLAGGIIGIHLNAFFGTCKMAYSLYTVIMRMK